MSDKNEQAGTGRVYLDGYLDVPAERWGAVREALEDHIALTLQEPGCIKFQVVPCADIERRLLVSEIFEDQQAFEAHQARAKTSPWAEISAGIPREYAMRTEP